MKTQANAQQLAMAINSGSSSLKIGVFDVSVADCPEILRGSVERIGRRDGHLRLVDPSGAALFEQSDLFESQEQALHRLVEASQNYCNGHPAIIGHRIVHGGPELLQHAAITYSVLKTLKAAEHFAPLHTPQAIQVILASQQIFPGILQIACFDTAFHQTMPEIAKRLPLPAEFDRLGVRRFGFHGLSYESVMHHLADRLPERAVFAHLGSGSSLCAVRAGRSIDTSMGMTPTGGVMTGTRSGDLDPGVVLFLLHSEHRSAEALEEVLNHRSGLAALSGGEADMQTLLRMRKEGDPKATFAVSAYTTAVRKAIGAYAALLGGIDLLVFTGGIGEHSEEIRKLICTGLEFLGLGAESAKIVVVPTEEERQIARICRFWINSSAVKILGDGQCNRLSENIPIA